MSKIDIHAEVTAKIVAAIEAGVAPWVKPWKSGGAPESFLPLRSTLEPYRGMNILLLLMEDRTNPVWFTYKQAAELGAQVRKGEKCAHVYYASKFQPKGEEKEFFMMKSYAVFNAEQIDGLPEKYTGAKIDRPDYRDPAFDHLGAKIVHGGNRACYSSHKDAIQLPFPEQFKSQEDYFSTKAHEFTHWTGHSTRLDRKLGNRFGSNEYAFEELIAELGAAMLCCHHGIAMEPRPDHAQYIANWLEVMKGDKKAIFTAASMAQKAVDFLLPKALAKAEQQPELETA